MQKHIFCYLQKWQKINFCTRKSLKLSKTWGFFQSENCIFGSFKLFSVAKNDFLPFLKMQIMLFWTFEIALFSPILEHCVTPYFDHILRTLFFSEMSWWYMSTTRRSRPRGRRNEVNDAIHMISLAGAWNLSSSLFFGPVRPPMTEVVLAFSMADILHATS